MKRAQALAVSLLLATVPVFAQGNIGVYADPSGSSCQIIDQSPGLLPIYVVHIDTPGATASQFYAPIPSCMIGAAWISDTNVFSVTIGDSQGGVAIGYGQCLFAPIHVLTINVFGQGLSDACCGFGVFADPDVTSGQIEIVDCGGTLVFAGGVTARVNGDGSCGCAGGIQSSTWGQVKAIYDQ